MRSLNLKLAEFRWSSNGGTCMCLQTSCQGESWYHRRKPWCLVADFFLSDMVQHGNIQHATGKKCSQRGSKGFRCVGCRWLPLVTVGYRWLLLVGCCSCFGFWSSVLRSSNLKWPGRSLAKGASDGWHDEMADKQLTSGGQAADKRQHAELEKSIKKFEEIFDVIYDVL